MELKEGMKITRQSKYMNKYKRILIISNSFPLLGTSCSLTHNNIEIRPIKNPKMASKCSSERKSHSSHFKSEARNI